MLRDLFWQKQFFYFTSYNHCCWPKCCQCFSSESSYERERLFRCHGISRIRHWTTRWNPRQG